MTDFSKIGKSNRQRGGAYERKIAHMLTELLGCKFKRSPRSGALLREGAFNGVFLGGDLACEKDFKFSIECKNCKDSNIESILKTPNTASLIKYWCQCVYDAKASSTEKREKLPLLFFHMKSVRKDYACMCDKGMAHLTQTPFYMAIPSIAGPVKIKMDNMEVEMVDLPPINIMLAEDFARHTCDVFYGE